jgi:putative transcriptional regulator
VDPLGGSLLIAGSSLFDPSFRRTVVLIGHHDDEGAVGVVLNRPTEHTVADAAPPLASLVPSGERLYLGGPVQMEAAVVVADFERPEDAESLVFGSVGFLGEVVDPEDLGPLRRARVFAGYAGWGPGQLEAEVDEDAWLVAPATAGDVFTGDPERLWSDVVGRTGPQHRLLATMPVDPSMN